MSYIGRVEQKASDIRRFNVTGSTSATHTLTWSPPNEQSLIITINGVKQQEDAYSVSGTTLTLTSALVSTDKMEVVGIQDVGETMVPGTGTITNDHISSTAAIALSKLATDPSNASNLASGTVPTARLGSGTADSSVFLRGDQSWAAAGGGLNSVQVFTSSGTWTRPSGITKVIMHVVGAGGGGGAGRSAYSYTGTGGGAGGLAIKLLDVSSISSSTITVGAAASAASVDASGSDGGSSSWADGTNTITANGGDGGLNGGDSVYEPGGTASGGDINITGGSGSAGPAPNIASYGGGQGGICAHGFGGGPGAMVRSNSDNDARGYGHGGSGGATNSTGGASAPGIVVVWEYK